MIVENNVNDNYEPTKLIDEYSVTEYYIGLSTNGNDTSANIWKIKRIWKVGNVWNSGYPNGIQLNEFIWDNRYGYNYE